ncbi:MAG: alcohol dehydrogenase, partial [Nitrospinota bacterium]
MKMRAALLYGIQDLRIEERPVPALAPGEVLVRVDAALTCGTDLKTFQRGHPVLLRSLPAPFGHEFAGTIVETGPEVEGFSPGMAVTGGNSAPCRHCLYCQKGQPNLCEHLTFLQGTYAEYLRI